jgi:hypothetical protein
LGTTAGLAAAGLATAFVLESLNAGQAKTSTTTGSAKYPAENLRSFI